MAFRHGCGAIAMRRDEGNPSPSNHNSGPAAMHLITGSQTGKRLASSRVARRTYAWSARPGMARRRTLLLDRTSRAMNQGSETKCRRDGDSPKPLVVGQEIE